MRATILRALGASRVAAAEAALARAHAEVASAKAEQATLNGLADMMDRGDADQLINAKTAGAPRGPWNRDARSGKLKAKKVGREYLATRGDVAEWLASLASPASPAPTTTNETEEPADPFERARARARDRRAA